MRTSSLKKIGLGLLLMASAGWAFPQWTAYNDHRVGTGPDVLNTTASNVTTYSVAAANTAVGGPLTNFLTGARTTPNQVGVRLLLSGRQDGNAGGSMAPTNPASPAATIFTGKVAWSNSALYFGGSGGFATSEVRMTFTNLVPGRVYNFRGTSIRGGGYTTRWTHVTLDGTSNSVPAHGTALGSPGIITNGWAPYGNNLRAGTQAIFNSGENRCGDVVGWNYIRPANGSNFSVICSNWTQTLPGGGTNNTYAYAINALVLEEVAPVQIVSQPQSLSVCLATPFTLNVSATGGGVMGYQWRRHGTNLAGATNASYSVASASAIDGGPYVVVVTNFFGAVTSSVATVSVANTGITIVSQPTNTVATWSSPATFSVGINPDASVPVYRWYVNAVAQNSGGTLIPGANGPQYTLPAAYETNVAYYYVTVSNCVNSRTSQVASLSLRYDPIIVTVQPQDSIVQLGGNVTLTVAVTGSRPSYQWYRTNVNNGASSAIPDATNATLTLNNLQFTNSGYYHVLVTNPASAAVSRDAALIVTVPTYDLILLTNQVWRYNQSGVDLGTAWRATEYTNEASWPTGRGVFAYESGNAFVQSISNTVLSLTNISGTTNLTFYFRTTFVLTNDPYTVQILTSNLVDDAHVVYVNGVEAFRSTNFNPAPAVINYGTFARAAHQEGVWETGIIPSTLLVKGTNTLAVEVHQNNMTSSDVVMGLLGKVVFLVPSIDIVITNQPADLTVEELKPATFSVGYIGSAVGHQWYYQPTTNDEPQLILGALQPTLTVSNTLVGTNDGYYFVVLSNVLTMVQSRSALLTILPDTNGPALVDADAGGSTTVIWLSFNEPLDPTNNAVFSPTNKNNFLVTNTLNGATNTVLSAVFTNATNVILTVATPLSPWTNYIVTVRGAVDMNYRHNVSTNLSLPVRRLLTLTDWPSSWASFQWIFSGMMAYPTYITDGTWMQRSFNPSAWVGDGGSASDPAVFRVTYMDTDPNVEWPAPPRTALTQGAGAAYFHQKFELKAQPSPARSALAIDHFLADGATLYVNGTEVLRTNMAAGPLDGEDRATVQITVPTEVTGIPVSITNLFAGTNAFCATAFPYDLSDNDFAFAARLLLNVESMVTGKVVITTPPTNVTILEGRPAYFGFRGAGGATFQWLSNNVPVAGATAPSLTIAQTPRSANGSLWRIAVSNYTGAVTSSPALLTVIADTNGPALVSAYLNTNNTITVSYDETVETASATTLANYAITNASGPNATITGLSLANGTNVIMTLSGLLPGTHTIVVNGVKDPYNNMIAPNSAVTVGIRDWVLVADGLTQWRYNQENIDLGTEWRLVSYNDTPWQQGLALFDGKWDGNTGVPAPRANLAGEPVRTQLSPTNAENPGRIPTYYFRSRPVLPVFGPGATMTISHILDDGAAFYMNGYLLYSIGTPIPTTFPIAGATRTVGDAALEGPFNVPVTNVFAGTNVFAAELKQQSATSSDATFGAYLTITVPSYVVPPPPPDQGCQPGTIQPVITITRPTTNTVQLSWANQSGKCPYILLSATNIGPSAVWTPIGTNTPYVAPSTNKFQVFRLVNQ